MEPAGERPDDLHPAHGADLTRRAAMEPAGERPDDPRTSSRRSSPETAAMEPAGERPDDASGGATAEGVFYLPPQWSRPVNGRTTDVRPINLRRSPVPQWSRPVNGRTTSSLNREPPGPMSRNGAGR